MTNADLNIYTTDIQTLFAPSQAMKLNNVKHVLFLIYFPLSS